MIGTIKWFDSDKGYGFIFYDNKDIYVHYSSILDGERGKRNLIKDELVKFDVINTPKGLRAKNVETIKTT